MFVIRSKDDQHQFLSTVPGKDGETIFATYGEAEQVLEQVKITIPHVDWVIKDLSNH